MIYAVSFAVAAALLLPEIAWQRGFEFPGLGVLSVPATGLGYMAVFFHEIGHTLARWLFGYPALPSFDFQHGGGMTYDFERKDALLYAVYALAALGAVQLFRKGYYLWLIALVAAVLAHLAAAFNTGHEVFAMYMGHGFEILVGCFCILRGCIGHTEYGAAEKWLNMIFGMFVLARNALMSWNLMTDELARGDYEGQKGGHGFGDFSRIADILDVRLETVSAGSLLILAGLLAVTLLLIVREKMIS